MSESVIDRSQVVGNNLFALSWMLSDRGCSEAHVNSYKMVSECLMLVNQSILSWGFGRSGQTYAKETFVDTPTTVDISEFTTSIER